MIDSFHLPQTSLVLGLMSAAALSAVAADFNTQVKPILEANCVSCHKPDKAEGKLDLTTHAAVLKGGSSGGVLKPGDPAGSELYRSTTLGADADDLMPPPKKGGPLPGEITGVLKEWIAAGAQWPEGATLAQRPRVDFAKDIQPILELSCVRCHHAESHKGGLRLDTKEQAFSSGENAPNIVPFHPEKSALYTFTVLPVEDDNFMPPTGKGDPLTKEQCDLLRSWIEQGAPWPDGVNLIARKATIAETGSELDRVRAIREKIISTGIPAAAADMKSYTNTIPGSEVTYEMVPIPGGEFVMGSPDSEKGHKPDEGPQHKLKIEPFWMEKYEITWNEFELFMYPHQEKMIREMHKIDPALNALTDAQARPTQPYVEMSFGMGKDGYPAISMTQHAANKYCQWLSAKTGHFYRLPTEAEWEYACRAGTTTAYSFGDDPSQLGQYAWYGDNSDWKYQKVGKKKPNPWGLYDMHGNVSEWTLDQYQADFYQQFAGKEVEEPWNQAKTLYPRVARGGSWDDDDPLLLRSAARKASSAQWKRQDPQLPKSIWYLTDAQFVGFRIIRPLKVPPAEEMEKYWNLGRMPEN
jgi:formylglycine-generating enzyme required for sulfatase activity